MFKSFDKFKSAIYNAVGNLETAEGGPMGSLSNVSLRGTRNNAENITPNLRPNRIQIKEKVRFFLENHAAFIDVWKFFLHLLFTYCTYFFLL